MLLGGGQLTMDPIWNFCGLSFPSTAVVDFCVTDWIHCKGTVVDTPQCAVEKKETGLYILLLDAGADGWGGAKYQIRTGGTVLGAVTTGVTDSEKQERAGELKASGTLTDGQS
eukprot:gene2054-4016_t